MAKFHAVNEDAAPFENLQKWYEHLASDAAVGEPFKGNDPSGEDAILVLDEMELHDLVVGLRYMDDPTKPLPGEDWKNKPVTRGCLTSIRVRAVGYDWEGEHIQLEEKDRAELEKRFNALLETMNELDCFLHDVAEYTC